MRKITTLIFDLDGTLTFFKINFMEARREIINHLIEFGIPNGLVSVEQRIMDMVKIVENYLKTDLKAPDKIRTIKNQIEEIITKYEMEGAKQTDLKPGARDLLKNLKTQRCKIGLFTLENRKITNFILEKFAIEPFFGSIVTRDDVINPKPHPDHLRMVLKQLDVLPQEILVVGDNPVDLECAKQIKAISIALVSERHTRNELFKAGADFVVDNLLEINDILKAMS
ncbi:MAG: HAD family hydrolase [Promethearchaeota archaeon]